MLSVEVNLIDPAREATWDRLVASHAESTFFHRAAWASVICQTYGHEAPYIHCSEGDKTVALIPMIEVSSVLTGRRGVCLPFTDVCGPLVFGNADRGLVMNVVSDLARQRRWKYFEFRGSEALPALATPAVTFHGHSLDLRRSTDQLLASFSSSVRRAIRKADRSGLKVEISATEQAVAHFYRLHVQTRKRHGLPPQPFSFFRNLHKHAIDAGLGFVVLATIQSRLAAAALFLTSGKTAIYKFGASDENLQEHRGANLVMWEAIKFLAQDGFETLHFGRTSTVNAGLRRFKLGWGTEERAVEYFRFDAQVGRWSSARDRASGLHNKIFGSLPRALNRLAGALIYPHLD